MEVSRGIDVSVYQGNINWKRVRRHGIDFAYIKAGQGKSMSGRDEYFTDRYFEVNIKNAAKCSIACGVYYYVTATSMDEAKREAEHYISIIEPLRAYITLHAAIDIEDITPPRYCGRLSRGQLTDIALVFAERLESAGFSPMLYTNRDYLENHLDFARLRHLPIWRAHWKTKKPLSFEYPEDFSDNMRVWQWGCEKIDGIASLTDSNYGYGILDENRCIKPKAKGEQNERYYI